MRITQMIAMSRVLLLALASAVLVEPQARDASVQGVHSSENGAIVRALLRDHVLPERDRLSRTSPPPRVYLVADTLAACPLPVTGLPCISDHVFNRAKLEAAKGLWQYSLTSLFVSINRQSQRLETVDHSELIVGPEADWTNAYPPLSIGTPAVVDNRALVYVRFGRSADWLVLLSKREGAWVVTEKVGLGAS